MLVWWAELSVTHLPLYQRGVYCHSERQLHLHTTCSLSISHSRTQPPSPLLQRLTPQETQTARTHKRRHALHRGTIKTSQSIRESETWKAFWKFELFLSSLLATLSVFTLSTLSRQGFRQKMCIKDRLHDNMIMRNTLCLRVISYLRALLSFIRIPLQFPEQQGTACKSTYRVHTLNTESASS